MYIYVINGSPKGEKSVTLQTVLYLEKKFPEHTFEILHAGQKIRSLERDFSAVQAGLERADLVLFSYPVYTFLAPGQLHRFIERLKEAGVCLRGKPMTQMTTSKHFYDHTAHRYVEDNAHDLGMRVIHGLSADMDDLLTERGRREAEQFFRYVLWCVRQNAYEPDVPVQAAPVRLTAADVPEKPVGKQPYDVVILSDAGEEDTAVQAMITRFRHRMPCHTRVIGLRDIPLTGGCLGCFRCAADGTCVYRDGFDTFLREEIQTADALVYAFAIRDHAMGSRFKMYDDRQFCNGHRTVTRGKAVGYLISGNYRLETNLQTVIEGRAQVGGTFLCGVATDETDPDGETDRLARVMLYALEQHYTPPANFCGVGGMKIFRDLIWTMQGLMREDHRFYKANGQYDFPQKKWMQMLAMYPVGAVMAHPDWQKKIQKKMGMSMADGILWPYRQVLQRTERETAPRRHLKITRRENKEP